MAKRQPGIAMPGQLEGPETHFSTDQTTNEAPKAKGTGSGGFPKYVFVDRTEGDIKMTGSIFIASQEDLDALPEGWKESPADFGQETHPAAVDQVKAE